MDDLREIMPCHLFRESACKCDVVEELAVWQHFDDDVNGVPLSAVRVNDLLIVAVIDQL